ncbi:DNA-binding protein [Streptomyces sp. NPDC085466]|uniref:DNA-binding protein n=1 Tax=Streptomyces sp. NPDC085466 TaxID=3365725 RepID=UPI0037D49756
MATTGSDRPETDFPRGVGAPATRALAAAGYTRLAELSGVPAADLAALHGVGPKALRVLGEALAERGLDPLG